MNAFQQMDWQIWKNLTDQEKMILMRQVLMYFVSPLTLVKNVTLKDFSIQGIKCRTFEFTINGEPFVFIPGQKETILGWEKGIEGLNIRELLADDPAFIFLEGKKNVQLPTAQKLAEIVNQGTSSLRKADILPMIVSKFTTPFGASFIGDFDPITASFTGEVEKFYPFQWAFRKQIQPQLTPEEALNWEYPEELFEKNRYYARLDKVKNVYHLYLHEEITLQEQMKKLRRFNFYFPTEDEYEYLMSGGSRKLFFWSHTQNFFDGKNILPAFQSFENMFGLEINLNQQRQQLLANEGLVKPAGIDFSATTFLEALLPLSPYARKEVAMSLKEPLSLENFGYRKITRLKS